jgi:hypothetical protein
MRPNIAPMATAPTKPATICAGLSICGGAQLGVTRTQQEAPMWMRSTSEMETWVNTQRDQRFWRHLGEPLELHGWAQSAKALPWSPVGRHVQAGGCLKPVSGGELWPIKATFDPAGKR